jgi:phosphoglucomutase/phosphomannomutase
LALDQKRKGQTVLDYLDRMERQFGHFRNEVHNLIMPGIEGKQNMARMLDRLRKNPPKQIGPWAVTGFNDLQSEDNWMGPLKGATDRQSRNVLDFHLGDNARVALRPSGTEPKAKAYIEVNSAPWRPGMSDDAWRAQCRQTDEQCGALAQTFLKLCQAP